MVNIWNLITYKKKEKKDRYDVVKTVDESTYVVKINNQNYFLKIKLNTDTEHNIYVKLHNAKHCNLIEYVSMNLIDNQYHFLYKYYDAVNLTQYLNSNILSRDDIYDIFTQIVYGIDFLHKNNVIHCDLKPDNILVLINDKVVKIVDLDLARECNTDEGIVETDIIGTLSYIAPESYDLHVYSKKSDMWSLGVILFIMLTNRFPHNIELSVVNSNSNLYRYNEFKHIDLDSFNIRVNDKTLIKTVKNLLSFVDADRMSTTELLAILKY